MASSARVLYVTGKGGAGKSTVAIELGREAARRGLATAIVDLRESAGSETGGAPALGPRLEQVVLDPQKALHHLVTRLLRFRFLSKRLLDSRTFAAVAAAAPGVKDLVYLSYLCDLSAGRTGHRLDLVIVNGVASGHTSVLLGAPRRIVEMVPVGPAAHVARDVADVLHDAARFRAAVVAMPEELAVVETADLHAKLAELGIAVTPTVVNGVYPSCCNEDVERWLESNPGSSDGRLYLARRRRQLALAGRVASPAGLPVVLPYRFDGDGFSQETRQALFERVVAQ